MLNDVAWATAILVSLYLPGHFVGGWILRKGDGLMELALLRTAAAIGIATPVLISLSLLGWFTRPAIVLSFGIGALITWILRGDQKQFIGLGIWDAVGVGLGIVAFALYARPAEYLLNDRDPGVYALVADKLARTGELISRDPLVGAIVPFHQFTAWTKYPGFYIYGNDQIVPQFFPGPFALLGLGNLVGGLGAELYVVPVLGALSAIGVYLLGRELFGRWAGLIGAALLIPSFAQVWWARHPSSETITQFFVVFGLLFAIRFVNGGGRGNGLFAGLLLGGAMLVRIDAVLALAAIPLLVGLDWLLRRPVRSWAPLCVPLVVFGGATLLFANTVGGRYLNLIYRRHGLDRFLELSPYLAGAIAILVLAVWMARRRWSGGISRMIRAHGRTLSLGAAAVLILAAMWAYFVMPVPWSDLPDGVANFHDYDSQVVVRMLWFITPVVAVLGIAGFLLASYRADRGIFLLLGAMAGFGVAYVVLPNVAPDLPWATRRFVPIVFPGFALLAGYVISESGRLLGKLVSVRVGVSVAVVASALALGFTVNTAMPVYGIQELGGASKAFDKLNREIPETKVIYVEALGDDYASTLDYLYGRPTLAYDRERFEKEASKLRQAGLLDDSVYVTVDDTETPSISGVKMRKIGEEKIQLPRLSPRFKEVPAEEAPLRAHFRIYRVEST